MYIIYVHTHTHLHTLIAFLYCREPTDEELSAVNKIQKAVKKHLDQQIVKCLQSGMYLQYHTLCKTHAQAMSTQ